MKPGAAFRAQMYFLYERHRRLLEAHLEDSTVKVVSDFLFEKDKIFAYINLDNEELKLYERYFDMLAPSVPAPDLADVSSGQAQRAAEARQRKKVIRRKLKSLLITLKLFRTLTSTSSFAIPLESLGGRHFGYRLRRARP